MLDQILKIDQEIFIYLNSLHFDALDDVMLFVSNSHVPIIAILLIFFVYGFAKYRSRIFVIFIFFALTFALSDMISSKVLKPLTGRLRPCHESSLQDLYSAGDGCGGRFSFVSAHAANSFSVLTFIWLIFGKFNKIFLLSFPYAALVSYSRIYLARHYLLDIIFGALLGISLACLVFKIMRAKTNLLKSR